MTENKSIKIILLLSLLSKMWVMLNYEGVYWDDWALVSQSSDTIINKFFNLAGHSGWITSYLHILFIEYGGVFFYRLALVFFSVLNVFFIHRILSSFNFLSSIDVFFICVIYMSVPYFEADLMLINFPYVFFYSIFLLAFYLYAINAENRTGFRKFIILCIFFLSFIVNSLIPFYGLFLLYVFYVRYFDRVNLRGSIVLYLKNEFDCYILIFVFALFKFYFSVPSGQYANYNSLSLHDMSIIGFFIDVVRFLHGSVWVLFSDVFHVILDLWWVIILLSASIAYSMRSMEFTQLSKKIIFLTSFGVIIFFLGAFPYLVVDKPPVIDGIESRFQLLLPLGFSVFLYFFVLLLLREKNTFVIVFALSFISVSLFLVKFESYVKYEIDWLYQEAIMHSFENSSEIINNDTFSYMIESPNKNIRRLRFYELNGYSKKVFHREDKLFAYKVDLNGLYKYEKYRNHKELNFSSWSESSLLKMIIVDIGNEKIGNSLPGKLQYVISMKWLKLMDASRFENELTGLVKIEFKPQL